VHGTKEDTGIQLLLSSSIKKGHNEFEKNMNDWIQPGKRKRGRPKNDGQMTSGCKQDQTELKRKQTDNSGRI